MSKPLYSIDGLNLNVNYRDAGPWRSYELTTRGSTKLALLKNATISAIDQDGGERDTYPLEDATPEVERAVHLAVAREFNKQRGQHGAKAMQKKYGSEHLSRIGTKGGHAVFEKYGPEYMSEIGLRGRDKARQS